MTYLLVYVGVAGVAIDLLLHVLQMFPKVFPASVRMTSAITFGGCLLGGLSLVPQWNLALAVYTVAALVLSTVAFVTGREVCHEGT